MRVLMALEVLNLLVLLPSLSSSPRWVGTHALQAKMSTVSAATILTQSLAGLGLCCSSYILSAWGTAFANTRGRQAGRALMPARLGGLMVQPRGRVRPLRRTKAAHNERKRAWISPLLGKSLGFHSMEESKDGSRKMKMICAYWQGQNLVV